VLRFFDLKRPSFQRFNVSRIPYPLSFHALAHSFALSCTSAKSNSFRFKRFRTLCKEKGHGGEALPTFNLQTFKPSNLQTFQRSARPIAAHALWCHNPPRHAISSRSGKQLRSDRCLRIRERTLQVVPGSSVLRRVSGFVLTNPDLNWTAAGWPES